MGDSGSADDNRRNITLILDILVSGNAIRTMYDDTPWVMHADGQSVIVTDFVRRSYVKPNYDDSTRLYCSDMVEAGAVKGRGALSGTIRIGASNNLSYLWVQLKSMVDGSILFTRAINNNASYSFDWGLSRCQSKSLYLTAEYCRPYICYNGFEADFHTEFTSYLGAASDSARSSLVRGLTQSYSETLLHCTPVC